MINSGESQPKGRSDFEIIEQVKKTKANEEETGERRATVMRNEKGNNENGKKGVKLMKDQE